MGERKGNHIEKKNKKVEEVREALATNSASRGLMISCEEN